MNQFPATNPGLSVSGSGGGGGIAPGSLFPGGVPAPAATGGVGLATLFRSPADMGVIRAANSTAGNFTVGYGFQPSRRLTITGVRFYSQYAGNKSWKISLYRFNGSNTNVVGTQLATFTSGPIASGDTTLSFAAPIAITPIQTSPTLMLGFTYMVTTYDTAGLVFTGIDASSGDNAGVVPSAEQSAAPTPRFNGPSIWELYCHLFWAGDAQPSINNSSQFMVLEPVFTVP